MDKIIKYPFRRPLSALSKGGRYFVNLDEEKLKRWAKQGVKVELWPGAVIEPNEWLRIADRTERYFKKPYPMILRGAYLEEASSNQKLF